MIFTKFLVFILVHGGVVRSELYPMSVANHVAQMDDNPDYFVEPLEGNLIDEAFLASYQNDPADDEDIVWIKENIVDRYGFVKDPAMDGWIKQPNFKGDIGSPEFVAAANRAKSFFEKHNDWEATKQNPAFRSKDSCLKLLYITAARNLLVTHILYNESDGNVVICEKNSDNEEVIPDSVCFPEPYGSASCTSDYDVSLAGKDAGFVIEKFNNYFQSAAGFGKPSEIVFDTNVYAFTLQYAMPFLFAGLPDGFASGVEHNEQTTYYRMQELASAYYKVFKYNETFFKTMTDGAKSAMEDAMISKGVLEGWLETFKKMDAEVPMKPEGPLKTPEAFRAAHNKEYAKYVKGMSEKGGYNPDLLGYLAKAEINAAEALHTRGGIRHVVGVTQMKKLSADSLSTEDLWVSMIENWGEANKDYHHCKESPLEVCLLKSSKYMWRTFNAMRLIWERLPPKERKGLVQFRGKGFSNPEYAAKVWMGYRKQAKTEIPKEIRKVRQFFKQFRCKDVAFGEKFSPACISKMNEKVNAYNEKLAGFVTDEPEKRSDGGRTKGGGNGEEPPKGNKNLFVGVA